MFWFKLKTVREQRNTDIFSSTHLHQYQGTKKKLIWVISIQGNDANSESQYKIRPYVISILQCTHTLLTMQHRTKCVVCWVSLQLWHLLNNVLPTRHCQLQHRDTAGPLMSYSHVSAVTRARGGPLWYWTRSPGCCHFLFVQHHVAKRVPVCLHGQTCRWQMASWRNPWREKPISWANLESIAEVGKQERANTPLQGERELNILPAWAAEIQLQTNEEWADLLSPPSPSPSSLLSPPPSLPHLLSPSWSSSWTVATQVSRSLLYHRLVVCLSTEYLSHCRY